MLPTDGQGRRLNYKQGKAGKIFKQQQIPKSYLKQEVQSLSVFIRDMEEREQTAMVTYFNSPLRICCTASFPICAAVKPCKEMMEGSEP